MSPEQASGRSSTGGRTFLRSAPCSSSSPPASGSSKERRVRNAEARCRGLFPAPEPHPPGYPPSSNRSSSARWRRTATNGIAARARCRPTSKRLPGSSAFTFRSWRSRNGCVSSSTTSCASKPSCWRKSNTSPISRLSASRGPTNENDDLGLAQVRLAPPVGRSLSKFIRPAHRGFGLGWLGLGAIMSGRGGGTRTRDGQTACSATTVVSR